MSKTRGYFNASAEWAFYVALAFGPALLVDWLALSTRTFSPQQQGPAFLITLGIGVAASWKLACDRWEEKDAYYFRRIANGFYSVFAAVFVAGWVATIVLLVAVAVLDKSIYF